LVILALLSILTVLVVHAEPVNLTEGSYVLVETPEGPVNITHADTRIATSPSASSHYISQGEIVYLGDKLDISGVVPPYPELAYWDGYDMYDSNPTFNITLPQQKAGYYNFSIDGRFTNRPGKWYKYADKFERAGNNLAFIVAPRPFYNYTLTFPNGTMIYVSELPDFTRLPGAQKPIPEIMPVKHVADYLITSDDSLNISISKLSAVWIFDGHDNSIQYATNESGEIIFNDTQIGNLEPGDYKILIQSIGNITPNLDVIFSDKTIKWFDRSVFDVKTISTLNLVPTEAIRNLEEIFPHTYDTYKIKTLAVQDPEITIGYMSQVGISSAKEYYKDPDRRGNVSLMDVRGYTNTLPGTNLTVTLDEAGRMPREATKLYTYPGKSQGTYLGDMRYYQVYVPLYWDDLKPGMHNLTARTELGGYAVANFPVTEEAPNSYVPPQTIRFMGDRNPWVPTPTPEIRIQKEIVTVTQQIPMPIPPSDQQIKEAAQGIVNKQNNDLMSIILIGVLSLGILALFGWFGYSIWRAKKK
jgi:hypothetical protein